jgi:hypothetical protein
MFSGEVEGRNVTLCRHRSGALKVTTTQRYAEATDTSSDGITHVGPFVISKGDTIKVDAPTAKDLEGKHQRVGFSAQATQQIVAHAKHGA